MVNGPDGVKHIYPSLQGGEIWYLDPDNPEDRTVGESISGNQEDGFETSSNARLGVETSAGYDGVDGDIDHGEIEQRGFMEDPEDWRDVEITAHWNFIDEASGGQSPSVSLYCRGANHTDPEPWCPGFKYASEFNTAGEHRFQKEQWHNSYADPTPYKDISQGVNPPLLTFYDYEPSGGTNTFQRRADQIVPRSNAAEDPSNPDPNTWTFFQYDGDEEDLPQGFEGFEEIVPTTSFILEDDNNTAVTTAAFVTENDVSRYIQYYKSIEFNPFSHGWFGHKFMAYNVDIGGGKVGVKLEAWIDLNIDNNWVKIDEFLDDGGWGDSGDACGGDPDQIGTWGGPLVTFRLDSIDTRFRNLSVRSITVTGQFPPDPNPPPSPGPPPPVPPPGGGAQVIVSSIHHYRIGTFPTVICHGEEVPAPIDPPDPPPPPGTGIITQMKKFAAGYNVLEFGDTSSTGTTENE